MKSRSPLFRVMSKTSFIFVFFFLSCGVEVAHKENISNENLPQEITTLNEKIIKNPQEAELYYQRAKYYFEKKDFVLATADINQSLKYDSTKSNYYLLLSDLYFVQNKTSKSKESLERVLSLDSKNIDALLKLAELYFYVQKHQQSIEYIDKVLLIDQYVSKAYFLKGMNFKEMGDTARAISSMQTAVEQDPQYYSAFIQLGILYASKKNPLALEYYQNAIKINSASLEAFYGKAKFYQDMNQWNKAVSAYEELLQIDPEYKSGLYNLGVIYLLHLKLYEKAINYFNQAIASDPKYAEAYYARATCYQLKGDKSKAAEDFKIAQKINPKLVY